MSFIFLFLIAAWAFIFYSKIFFFEKLIITNNNLASIGDIYKKFQEINHNRRLFQVFSLANNLLFWNNDSCDKIGEASLAIESINCQKNFLNKTIKILVKEREPLFLFYDEGSKQYFYLDKEGVLFYSINENNAKNLILIYNKSSNIYHLGDKLTIDLEKVKDLATVIQKNFNFRYFELENQDIVAVCDKGFRILISLNKLLETTKFIPKLFESNFELNNLEYLDLRFLPKIYYK
ncbi:MAG: cell division protein FtsQ/DivIB [Minisyncoccia bacterium]